MLQISSTFFPIKALSHDSRLVPQCIKNNAAKDQTTVLNRVLSRSSKFPTVSSFSVLSKCKNAAQWDTITSIIDHI